MKRYSVFSMPLPPIPITSTTVEPFYATPTVPSYTAASSTLASYNYGNGGGSMLYPSATTIPPLETSSTEGPEVIENCNCSSNQTAIIALGSFCGLFFICICILIFLLILSQRRYEEAQDDRLSIGIAPGHSGSRHHHRRRASTELGVNGRDDYSQLGGLSRGHGPHRRSHGLGRSVTDAETTASKRRRTYPAYAYAGMGGQPVYFPPENGNADQEAVRMMQPAYFPGPRAPHQTVSVTHERRVEEDVTEASDVGSSNQGGADRSDHSSVAGRRHHSTASGSTARGRSSRKP